MNAVEFAKLQGGVWVKLRNGEQVILFTSVKGGLGRVRTGRIWKNRDPITWNLEGRWRWDGQDHPLDIVEGFQQT
jgi:hypothetical protein